MCVCVCTMPRLQDPLFCPVGRQATTSVRRQGNEARINIREIHLVVAVTSSL